MPIFSELDGIINSGLIPVYPPYWRTRCQPRILIVTDGPLNYQPSDRFGLSRFIEAIAHHSSATLKPALTLAHRGAHATPVAIAGQVYPVLNSFNYATANPAVTINNYDQIWMFGVNQVPIGNPEIVTIANFMNAGGGVFSTGDHADLGSGMGARLPRIRHMRNWRNASAGGVPMGGEPLPLARERIDTISNPGVNGAYEFDDQSDDIPQRIYPNYTVTGPGSGTWAATIHPVLRLPGAAATRSQADTYTGSGFNAGLTTFSLDIDVLPDHAHESECFEVSTASNPTVLNGTYNDAGLSFPEFPTAASGGGRVGAEILAFSVSGGRTVWNSLWKPPVRPRMFGAMSAFDGHRADPLTIGAARPGRIMCDATWHHFVNINLDGIGSSRQGLGSWSGMAFTPSAQLLKIYKYYQNMVSWLQPSNRVWCNWIIDTSIAVERMANAEELFDVASLKVDSDFEHFGRLLVAGIDAIGGAGRTLDLLRAAIFEVQGKSNLASLLDPHTAGLAGVDIAQLVALTLGKTMPSILPQFPVLGDPKFEKPEASNQLHERLESTLQKLLPTHLASAAKAQLEKHDAKAKSAKAAIARALA